MIFFIVFPRCKIRENDINYYDLYFKRKSIIFEFVFLEVNKFYYSWPGKVAIQLQYMLNRSNLLYILSHLAMTAELIEPDDTKTKSVNFIQVTNLRYVIILELCTSFIKVINILGPKISVICDINTIIKL